MRYDSTRSRRGLSLIESAMALALAGIVAMLVMWVVSDTQERSRALRAAEILKEVKAAAGDYLEANRQVLLSQLSGNDRLLVLAGRKTETEQYPAGPAGTGLPSLQGGGYLSSTFIDMNPYGQSHAVIVRRVPDRDRLEAVVTSTGGGLIPDRSLSVISNDLGASGGFVANDPLPGQADRVTGTSGSWNAAISDWTADAVGPSQGRVLSALAVQENRLVEDFLYRNSVPGRPEANRMETDLAMGVGTDVNSITDLRAISNGERQVEFGQDSFLTLRNRDTYIRLEADRTQVSRNLDVSGTAEIAGDVAAGRNISAGISATAGGQVVAGGELSAGRDAVIGSNDTSTGTVTASRMVDPANPSHVLDPAGNSVAANSNARSNLNRLKTQYFDLDTALYSTSANRRGVGSTETLGSAVSRLWSCFVEYRFVSSGPTATGNINSRPGLSNPGTHWVRGPRLDGTSNVGELSRLNARKLDNECNGPGCGLQVRVNCGDAPPAVPPSVDTPDECPPWATGTFPNCVYTGASAPVPAPAPTCPVGTTGTPPNCSAPPPLPNPTIALRGYGYVSCGGGQFISCSATSEGADWLEGGAAQGRIEGDRCVAYTQSFDNFQPVWNQGFGTATAQCQVASTNVEVRSARYVSCQGRRVTSCRATSEDAAWHQGSPSEGRVEGDRCVAYTQVVDNFQPIWTANFGTAFARCGN